MNEAAIFAIGFYLVMAGIKGNAGKLFQALKSESGFFKWILAVMFLEYVGSRMPQKIRYGFYILITSSIVLSQSKSISGGAEIIKEFFAPPKKEDQ